MLIFLHILLKKRGFLWVGILLLLSAFSSRVVAYVLFNQANLARLQGEYAITTYQQALILAPNDFHIRWQMARAALDLNDGIMAAEVIAPLARYASREPSLFADILRTSEAIGQLSQVTDLYEANTTVNRSVMVSDTVALAYIAQGKFEEALVFRPTDLYLTNKLWQWAQSARNLARADTIREQLVYFPPSAIELANERLLKYTGEALLSLLESKVWAREQTVYVIDYFVWQHYRAPEIEQILQRFRNRYPNEPVWQGLATELAQRRAKMPPLDFLLPLNSDEKVNGNLVKSTQLNTFDRLAVGRDDIFWQWGAWLGKGQPDAIFFSGLDPLESYTALRIMSLWHRPARENEAPPYAEYSSKKLMLEPNTDYTLTLRYKSDKLGKAIPFIALLEYSPIPRFTFVHTALPDTAGNWQTWQTSGKSYTEPIKVQLLLRMLGTGSVWFDNVQLIKGNPK